MSKPMIDLIVTHYDEPWETGKKFFDMLAMQRNIDFSDIRVILVQDGKENALDWKSLLVQYPYKIRTVTIRHSGPATARNIGLDHAEADWVMFCDFDDLFADIAAVRGILNVLPNDDADIIWMKTFREERVQTTKRDHENVFINCLEENYYYTTGKLFKREVLLKHNLFFNGNLQYEYENAMMHVALSVIPGFRVLGLVVDFFPYMKTYRPDSWTSSRESVSDRIQCMYLRDRYLVDEYQGRRIDREYRNAVAETVFDAYYMLNSTPCVLRNPESVLNDFREFYGKHKMTYHVTSETEKEVVLDNCINKMLGTVQNLYNYHGIEISPPGNGMQYVNAWLEEVESGTFTLQAQRVPSQERVPQAHSATKHEPKEIQPVTSGHENDRVVVYCGTYNTYANMLASAKSLLCHTQVDRIFFLTEDDEFPYEIPDCITNINVSGQSFFPPSGPNFENVWSYMCMMRAAFPQIFPVYNRILSLDIDVVINDDISNLWDLNLDGYYYAGVPEPCRQRKSSDPVYCNFGVIMLNLRKLREDNMSAELIHLLNTTKLACPEQDAYNRLCAHHILPLSPDYNYTPFSHITGEPDREIIIHYAGLKYWKHFELVQKYAKMPWNEILRGNGTVSHGNGHPERIVVYSATRSHYHMMLLSARSLLHHTDVDKIYFLIEDDTFPEPVPDNVECVNISNQHFFPQDGPNYGGKFSYIVLLRAAYPLMFPQHSTILSIDADTLVRADISAIWATNLSGSYLAAVQENRTLLRHGDYYNCGVMLMNLDLMRRDNLPERAISRLNSAPEEWKEQDVLNQLCFGRITPLPAEYNYCPVIMPPTERIRIRHYIGDEDQKQLFWQDAKQFDDEPKEGIEE